MEKTVKTVFVQIMERPARKLILRRSKKAEHYFDYCDEFGCGTPEKPAPWDILCGIKEAIYEPVGVWLPDNMRPEGTGTYAHAVEVPDDYAGELPEGFEIISLPPCKMLIFQGEPFDDEKYDEAIRELVGQTEGYDPTVYGYEWDDEIAPCFQLAPMGYRGYIEGRPVREIKKA